MGGLDCKAVGISRFVLVGICYNKADTSADNDLTTQSSNSSVDHRRLRIISITEMLCVFVWNFKPLTYHLAISDSLLLDYIFTRNLRGYLLRGAITPTLLSFDFDSL